DQGLAHETHQTVEVEGLAALMFTVADTVDPVEVGGETQYEIRVVNQGSKASTNVQVAMLLPPEMKCLAADGPTRHEIEAGRVAYLPIPSLAPKADAMFRLKIQAERAGDQRVRVQVQSDEMRSPVTKEESTRVYADE